MKKSIIAAIIAATALVPPALAQDRGGRWGGGGGRGERSASQPAHAQPQRSWGGPQRQQAQQPRGDRGQWRQPQHQPNAGQPQRQWSGNRGNGNRGQAPQFQGQPQRPQQFQAPQAQQQRQWRGNEGRRPQQLRGNQQVNGDRNRYDRNNRDWNRGNRNWNDNRGHDWNRGDRGGRWNNGWRGDNRYDWRGYRNSNRNLYRLPRYYAPYGWGYGYRRFSIGIVLSDLLFAPQYWINDPYYYRLPEVYGPYRWVRYYNDALLVDIETGEVVDTIYDIFW